MILFCDYLKFMYCVKGLQALSVRKGWKECNVGVAVKLVGGIVCNHGAFMMYEGDINV